MAPLQRTSGSVSWMVVRPVAESKDDLTTLAGAVPAGLSGRAGARPRRGRRRCAHRPGCRRGQHRPSGRRGPRRIRTVRRWGRGRGAEQGRGAQAALTRPVDFEDRRERPRFEVIAEQVSVGFVDLLGEFGEGDGHTGEGGRAAGRQEARRSFRHGPEDAGRFAEFFDRHGHRERVPARSRFDEFFFFDRFRDDRVSGV